jgi:hypothetical protein
VKGGGNERRRKRTSEVLVRHLHGNASYQDLDTPIDYDDAVNPVPRCEVGAKSLN